MMSRTLLLIIGLLAGAFTSVAQNPKFESIEEALSHPDSVEYIEINHLSEDQELEILRKFPKLKSLRLSNYRGTEAPEFISSLTQLNELQFVNDDIVTLPASYSRLVNLEKIEFVYDTHLDVPQTMQVLNTLPKLRELRIEGLANSNSLDSAAFPANLRVLSLRNNHLRILPDGVTKIRNLEILDVGDNYFQKLPNSLSNMESLNTVFLDQQPLLEFDQALKRLDTSSSLRRVYLGGNHLSSAGLGNQNKHKYSTLYDDSSLLKHNQYQPHIEWMVPFQTDMDHMDGETSIKLNINK